MLEAVVVFTMRGFDAGCKDKGVKAAGAGLGWAARILVVDMGDV